MITEIFGLYGPLKPEEFTLREVKYARSRLGVLKAFLQEMEIRPFDEIRIKDLCKAAEISEPSFYNYFPRKDDLFLYFISLWSVDVQLRMKEEKPGLSRIRALYRHMGRQSSATARFLGEVIAYQARVNPAERIAHVPPVSLAEKSLLFGRVEGLERISDRGIGPILRVNLAEAVTSGELLPEARLDALALGLGALFFGVPVIALHTHPDQLGNWYEMALEQLLAGSISHG